MTDIYTDKHVFQESKYFIPAGKYETERLSILHKVFSEPTKRFLNLAGVNDKNDSILRVADVGCGTGEMLRWLSQNIAGEVIGIDNDMCQLDVAASMLEKTSKANVKFICHDITEPMDEHEQFDVVYCRFLLHHLPRPFNALKNLLNLTKKGGKIIIGEPIMDGRWIFPEYPEYYEIYSLHLKNKAHHVWDPNYGKKLISEVLKCDNAILQHYEHFRPILTTAEVKRHHYLVLQIFGKQFVKNNLISHDRLEQLKKISLSIAEDSSCISDLFGLVLLCIEKA